MNMALCSRCFKPTRSDVEHELALTAAVARTRFCFIALRKRDMTKHARLRFISYAVLLRLRDVSTEVRHALQRSLSSFGFFVFIPTSVAKKRSSSSDTVANHPSNRVIEQSTRKPLPFYLPIRVTISLCYLLPHTTTPQERMADKTLLYDGSFSKVASRHGVLSKHNCFG